MSIETVLVPGASGGVGRETMKHLLNREVTIRAVTSTASNEQTLRETGADEVVVGDLREQSVTEKAIEGVDGVCCTVGSGFPEFWLGRTLVDGKGVCTLARAAASHGVEHVSLVSSIGVGNSKSQAPLALRLFLYRVLEAKQRGEDCLREADVTHTILRPGGLDDDIQTGDPVIAEGGETISGSIPRDDVARLLVASLWTPEAENRTFELASEHGLRDEQTGVVDIDWARPAD